MTRASMSDVAIDIEEMYYGQQLDIVEISSRTGFPVSAIKAFVLSLNSELLEGAPKMMAPTDEELNDMERHYNVNYKY